MNSRILNSRIQYIQDTLMNRSKECELRLHETIQKVYEKSQRLNNDKSLLHSEYLELKREIDILQSKVMDMTTALSIWKEAWAISTSCPPPPQILQEDRCVACGEVVPEGTQLCFRCRKIIEPGE